MENGGHSQHKNGPVPDREPAVPVGFEAVVPNPELKLMDQVREVLRLRHYAIRGTTTSRQR